ncbi:MAG: chromosome segregation protein SMC [Fretibacterium sp.]|nr:chromosome segregation protein SMC [Fretibacterium sp.]
MSIEFLRLNGFKSFGSSCEFAFSKGFSAIVGPNGSGKSNILDALRWVLGEGSPTSLRITRQSDLIFQGSANFEPSKEAEVSLKLVSGNDSALLKRSYSQEGGSVLQVDGTRVRLQDLGELKARFQLEGDAFAFIGQGEVAEAIHQRPMQRRHHLELLFGIDRYRKKRDDTYLRLASTLEEAQRIETLIRELENRREEIAPEVTVAVEAQGILDNLEIVRRDFYFARRFALEGRRLENCSRLQLQKEHGDVVRRWRSLWDQAARLLEERLRREGFDEEAFLDREQALLARKEALRRQGFAAATRVKALQADRASLNEERLNLLRQHEALETELAQMRKEEGELARTLEEQRASLQTLLDELEAGRAQAERERLRRRELSDEQEEKSLFCSRVDSRLRALLLARDEGAEERAQLEAERARLEESLKTLTRDVKELGERHEELSTQHTDAYSLCQKHAAALQQLQREKTRQEAELDALKESTESSLYPEPVRLLLSAARLGRIRSRPEVVAEAFSCPPHVAEALEAYLGGRQFWLLGHTFAEAQEGIELLKQRRSGRVTYLLLERCRPRFPDPRFRLPLSGVTGWALELITPRAPWEPALQHLLGDLLLVETYALGSELVKKGARFPIATLEGEVFAPSGTVSGGRMRQRGGAISHNQQVEEGTLRLSELKARIEKLATDLKAAEAREQDTARTLSTEGEKLLRLREEEHAARSALAALLSRRERLEGEGISAAEEAERLERELHQARLRLEELAEELAALGESVESKGGSSRLSAMQNEIHLTEERLRGRRDVLLRAERERGSLSEQLAGLDLDLAAGQEEEASQRELLAEVGRGFLEVRDALEKLRTSLETERGKVRRGHLRLERLRSRAQNAAAAATALEAELSALSERLSGIESELEQLRELWDEKYPYLPQEAAEVEGGRDLTSTLRSLERDLKALGTYNLGALSEDISLSERIDFLTEQLEDVSNASDELKLLIAETDAQVEEIFAKAMADIDVRFNALFQRLFAGGEARLKLQEEGEVWDRGVEIYARPPGKRLQNISQLSGGEQSLTAIAHLFAALEVARMPLAVLDEVDAALDEYNLIRFADLAREYSRSLQLIVMTHRRTTMERADLIYGVTMVEPGLSRIVSIDVESYR